eukprot:2352026-Rhodomonas_salina.1
MSSTAGHGTDTGGAMSLVICVRALLCTPTQGGRFLRPYPDPRRPSRRSTGGWPPLFGWGPQFQVYYGSTRDYKAAGSLPQESHQTGPAGNCNQAAQ